MLIDLTEILKGEEKVVETEVELGFDTFVSKLGKFPIVSKSPISLIIENQGDRKVHIEGREDLEILIPCSRCLEEVKTSLRLKFERELDLNKAEAQAVETLDEHNYLDGYNLDVDKLVYGEIVFHWPMKVLCKEDCKGICSTCGTNLNLGTCNCDSTDFDPRMARIRDIFSKCKEV